VSPPVQAARNYTHHRHLLLLSPKADTQYIINVFKNKTNTDVGHRQKK